MIRKYRCVASALLIIIAMVSWGYAGNSTLGTTGAQVLEMPVGTRAAGMGFAYVAVADDAESISYNPAGLAQIHYIEVPLYGDTWLEGIKQQATALVYSLRDVRSENVDDLGTLAAAFTELNSGDVVGRDTAGNTTQNFTVKDQVITGSYAKKLVSSESFGVLSGGVNAKFVTEDYSTQSFGAQAVDVGLLWQSPVKYLFLGAAVQNIGSPISYNTVQSDLPQYARLGAAVKFPSQTAILALDLISQYYNNYYLNAGAELWLLDTLALRGGYSSAPNYAGNGFTVGVGLSIKQMDFYFFYFREFNINFAFVPYGDLGNTSRVSIVMKLGAD